MKIIFLGPPGSGKSTQAKLLAEHIGAPYIEMSQLLRIKMDGSDSDAIAIKKAMKEGTLVPDKIVIRLLHERLENPDCKNGYILDGFPRSKEQLEGLPAGIEKVFYITLTDGQSIERLLKRGRVDESAQIIKRRLDIYHDLTEPVLHHFKDLGILTEVDGEPSIEEINQKIKSIVKNGKE